MESRVEGGGGEGSSEGGGGEAASGGGGEVSGGGGAGGGGDGDGKKMMMWRLRWREEKAIDRGTLPLLRRATLVRTFGQRNHVCLKDGSIIIPPYAPPQKMQASLIPPSTPGSIFVYFRGLFYNVGNDPEGGYYARGARALVWENYKNNPLFDISTEHPTAYYKDMQRAVFCLCPLGWAPWSPRLVEADVFGCIPVIIADDIVLPFADAIPWEEIGVFVAEKDVPKLDTTLTSIPVEEILRK
ncbi:Glycerol kinase [Castilleja foliolosa]|uniref:Glycerol kinase n=1 Tax=Castilleja foliolosa TaxID=1961234 RepID=A0ABD3ELM4_9LAMI